jgi:hypothetical protein
MRFDFLCLLSSVFVAIVQSNPNESKTVPREASPPGLGSDFFLRNEGANGSLNTRRNVETVAQRIARLRGLVPEGYAEPLYDPVRDAVCFTDPVYEPMEPDPLDLYYDFVTIFDFGFNVSGVSFLNDAS